MNKPKLAAAIAYFEDAIRESDEIIAECSPGLQAELTEQKAHFVVALEAMRVPLPDNKALTVEELREMIGGCAWCKDTDGINPGLLCLRHGWDDFQKEVHIWLLDEEGNTGVYDVEYMIKCGAKFYRRPPEKGE